MDSHTTPLDRLPSRPTIRPARQSELSAVVASERGALPYPGERIAMVYRHPRV